MDAPNPREMSKEEREVELARFKGLTVEGKTRWIENALSEDTSNRLFYGALTHDNCHIRHNMIEPEMVRSFCPLDNGKYEGESTSSLGHMDKLPLELLHIILAEELDLGSLTTLRAVNRRARSAIDSLPQYNAIYTHAPTSLRAALSIQVATYFTCQDMYDALCSAKCSLCGQFGAYIFLLTMQRACYTCFTREPWFCAMTVRHATTRCVLSPRDIVASGIPIARTLPGRYHRSSRKAERKRLHLVGVKDLLKLGVAVHGSMERMTELEQEMADDRYDSWEDRTLEWALGGENTRPPARPPYATWSDMKEFNPHRYMCVVGFPWLDRSTGGVQWGISCKGCGKDMISQSLELGRDQWLEVRKLALALYSIEEYIAHASSCETSITRICEDFETTFVLEDPEYVKYHSFCHVAGDVDLCGEGCSHPVRDESLYDTIVSTKPKKRQS